MIGEQKTGRLDGIFISMVSHEPPTFTVNGQPAQLAIATADGAVLAIGPQVAKELAAVVVNSYQAMWIGQGHLRVYSEPIMPIAIVVGPDHPDNPVRRRHER